MNSIKSLCVGLAVLGAGNALAVDTVAKKSTAQKTVQPAQLNQMQAMQIQESIGTVTQKFVVELFAHNFEAIESLVQVYSKDSKAGDTKITTMAKEYASKNAESIKKEIISSFEKVLDRSLTEQEKTMFVTTMISSLDQFFEVLIKEHISLRSKVLVKVEELKKTKAVAKK